MSTHKGKGSSRQDNQPPIKSTKRSSRAKSSENGHSEKDEFNCKLCEYPDTNEMAQCDTCDDWFHYECGGVTRDIEGSNVEFICPLCKSKDNEFDGVVNNTLIPLSNSSDNVQPPGVLESLNLLGVVSSCQVFTPGILPPGAFVTTGGGPAGVVSYSNAIAFPSGHVVTSGSSSSVYLPGTVVSSGQAPLPIAVSRGTFSSSGVYVSTNAGAIPFGRVEPPGVQKFVHGSYVHLLPPGIAGPSGHDGAIQDNSGNVSSLNSTMPGVYSQQSFMPSNASVPRPNSAIPGVNFKQRRTKIFPTEPLSSTKTSITSQNAARRRADLELKRLDEEYTMQKRYIENKYKLLHLHMNENSDSEESEIEFVKATTEYHRDKQLSNVQSADLIQSKVSLENDSASQNHFSQKTTKNESIPVLQSFPTTGNTVNFDSRNINTFHSNRDYTDAIQTASTGVTMNYHLTKQQIAARHVLPKDLPIFNGNIEEWPIFISNFESSTNTCGYTNDENMIRLQRCLKGKALDAVRSRLLLPSRVPDVIEMLRLLFGRPEMIINALIQKVRNEPPPKFEKLDTIIKFAMSVENLSSTIEASGLVAHLSNPVLVQEIVEKLPSQLKLNWAFYKQTTRDVNISVLANWLSEIAKAACEVSTITTMSSNSSEKKSNRESGLVNTNTLVPDQIERNCRPTEQLSNSQKNQSASPNCRVCKLNCELIRDCAKFINMSLKEKWDTVKKLHLCRRCLKSHGKNRCFSSQVCGINDCPYKHNRLLHNSNTTVGASSKEKERNHDEKIQNSEMKQVALQSFCNTNQKKGLGVLFRVIPVILRGRNKAISTFAFLDDGSSLSMIDESLADELGLDGPKSTLCLKWTSDMYRREEESKKVTLEVSGINSCNTFKIRNVHTVKNLDLPIQSVATSEITKLYDHLKGIPFESYSNARPQILIGLTEWRLGVPLSVCEGAADGPIATQTRLGWLVYGPCNSSIVNEKYSEQDHHSHHKCHCTIQTDESLHTIVKDHFSVDNFGVIRSDTHLESKDDQRARLLLEEYTQRIDNRYETVLLWKHDNIKLPNSYSMSIQRLQHLEKRMMREPDLRTKLNEQIQQYIAKGYARKLNKSELVEKHDRVWYLPIFPVFNPHKPKKLRIVWDAAAKSQGVSLNTMLLKGPDLLSALFGVLLRFRERRIAICGDIREMFHQVRIAKKDQHSQRFLWRTESHLDPDVMVMQVMTFGAKCSPSTAQFIKNTNARIYAQKYPRAALAITENHYVDDLLDCVDTPEEAVILAQNVKFIHNQAGFEIRNWLSNSAEVMKILGEAPSCEPKSLNLDTEIGSEKVLGMCWNTHSDNFMFTLQINDSNRQIISGEKRPTKREILRTLMTMFDPLGLIAHYSIYAKILLQDIWKSGLSWDEQINDEQNKKWKKWIGIVPILKQFRVPRCYFDGSWMLPVEIQLHIFVDASEFAYASVAYLRISGSTGIKCSLVGAKTRVAPLKMLSIPKLELLAALLGVRYSATLKDLLSININSIHYWTDSRTVMYWLQSEQRDYKQFVAFRIGEILESSNLEQWRWISTKHNVADEATKWKTSPDLSPGSRWLNGPQFLYTHAGQWPTENVTGSTVEELRPRLHSQLHHVQTNISREATCLLDFPKFSSWLRLVRTQATVSRFIFNIQAKRRGLAKLTNHYSSEELRAAENAIYRQTQLDEFKHEMAILELNRELPPSKHVSTERSSSIYNKCPYIDECGVLRAYGRIDATKDVDVEVKRKIILPKLHPVTWLVIFYYHLKYHHVGSETVVNEIRQKYSIPQLRATVKRVRKSCNACKISSAAPKPPRMADLPPARLATFTRPFSFVGIDYFGPLNVIIGRKVYKRWGVIFTCLTVRAVHIEIAHSMTTDSCILTITNFMARRGVPIEIFSDNGTNFHGCNNELKKNWSNVNQSELANKFTTVSTKWHFNPPAAPHMGGSWERLVKSIKQVLMQIKPNRIPTDELLQSYLLEVEAMVNSRPLTYVPLEDENDEALTPNHFLLGSSSGSKPIGSFTDDAILLRKNWMKSQQIANTFWKRWIREYLPTITRRSKWIEPAKPIEKGDLVIIVDENSDRNVWQRGKVIDTTLAKDGQVRRAVVQTASGILERPAIKLAVLDIGRNDDSKQLEESNSVLGGSVATAPIQ